MAAEDISSTATFTDGVPNLNMKICYVDVPLNSDALDWVDMANVGMTSVYMAIIAATEVTRLLVVGV
jgi:hypothetical protein